MVNRLEVLCQKTRLLEKQKSLQKFEFCGEMAETVGFEPTCGCPQTDFEGDNFGIFFYIFTFLLIKRR